MQLLLGVHSQCRYCGLAIKLPPNLRESRTVSYQVQADLSAPLRWPNRCARCGAKHGLQSASLSIGEVLDSRLKLTGGVEFETRMTTLRYPVCAAHARGLGIAALFNRQTAVMKGVRGVLWVLGVLGILPTLTLPFTVMSGKTDMPLGMLAMIVVPTLLMLGMIWARRAQPVQGMKRDGDEVTLRFTNADYGRAFERANP